ncbi:MAG TPA: rhomboid family intramembrane serine protease [Steroidobacteraceae bacterium]|nr:rhomboid family intramembrane serine protease [Steroidobacteraceae bacterium]
MLDQFIYGAPVCGVLLLAIVAISVSALSFAPQLIQNNLFRPYWMPRRNQYYTLVTSAFIHADYGHLLFNALTLWSFGVALERVIGSPRFFVLYVVGLLASGFGTYFKQRKNPDYACLGASGAILAVLFASIVYFPTQSIYVLPLPVPIPAPLYAVGFLAYTWYAARNPRGRINHDAHMDGALAGLAFVALTDFGAYWRLWQLL